MQVPADWFREWFNSPYYHKLYFERDENEAKFFMNNLLRFLNPAVDALMLDVACGRGRHSRILAKKGFDVTGFDLSPDSIRYARQYENDHLHFYKHDMRLPFRINYFDYAFNLFTSFGYFRTKRENNNAIRTISQALKRQGFLVLDYLNTHWAEENLIHKSMKEIDGIRFHLTKWFDETHFYKKILIEDEHLRKPLEFIEKIAKLGVGDFNEMFAYNGMQLRHIFGDYELNTYDTKKSPRLLMIARKLK
ncbi:MAG TPA: class I SAM-dependent methyltransferase [Puia sp.]|nr:class I SAM-dependent methyltransferase [Puia sp.]